MVENHVVFFKENGRNLFQRITVMICDNGSGNFLLELINELTERGVNLGTSNTIGYI